MIQLHDITDKPTGWIQLVKSLIRVVPLDHPMGPSVITLLLDDSPLPTKDSVLEVADMITYAMRRTPRRERNLCGWFLICWLTEGVMLVFIQRAKDMSCLF